MLRAVHFDAGLPDVLHSDWAQVAQAAELLRDGTFLDRTIYPAVHTYVYAALDVLVGAVGVLLGAWPTWDAFVARLQDPAVSHAIARGYHAALALVLTPAMYALARTVLPPRGALLAAAITVLDPMQTLLAHQARLHVPGVTALVLAAVPAARLLARLDAGPRAPGPRAALMVGAAAGAAAAVYQLGLMLGGAVGLCLLARVRPLRRAVVLVACTAVGLGLALGALVALTRVTGTVRLAGGRGPFADALTLGMHASAVAFTPGHVPLMLLGWLAVEPLRALALLLGARPGGLGPARVRGMLLFLVYPAVVLFVIGGGIGPQPRYSLSCTPFLAVPAAAACLALRAAPLRLGLAALLVLSPVAGSVRHDVLIGRTDTRHAMLDHLTGYSRRGLRTTVEAGLFPTARRMPPGGSLFPPGADYSAWARGVDVRRRMLVDSDAAVLACSLQTRVMLSADEEVMARLGFRLDAVLDPSPGGEPFVPNDPARLVPDMWRARMPGPRIEFWLRTAPDADRAADGPPAAGARSPPAEGTAPARPSGR